MSYLTQHIDPKKLEAIQVKKQPQIIEVVGEKLDPVEDWKLLQRETKDFQDEHEDAILADKLFAELLQKNGISLPSDASKKTSSESSDDIASLAIVEKERARKIKLLQLQLNL